MRKSILQDRLICKKCGAIEDLHAHEVFYGTANRAKSIHDKMVIYLCGKHHNLTHEGIHFDKAWDMAEKRNAQKVWMEFYNKTEEDFIKRYGRSYL